MSPTSALYVGTVSHHRLTPKRHSLRNRVYWLLLDLAEIDEIGASLRLFSVNARNFVSFQERDHGDRSGRPLMEQARALLRSAGIDDAAGRIQLLCMPRIAGYDFNPLSVYFCRAADGKPAAVIYEVSNTFGGRHSYVVPVSDTEIAGGTIRQACNKTFYVSPFLQSDMNYRFRTRMPADTVSVAVQARRNGSPVINTALVGHRRPLDDANLAKLAVTHPLLPMNVTGAIYWHGLKLWLRGFAVNPEKPSTAVTHSVIRPHE